MRVVGVSHLHVDGGGEGLSEALRERAASGGVGDNGVVFVAVDWNRAGEAVALAA